MKIHVLADLHREFTSFTPPATVADVVVLAGDTDLGIRGLSWAYETFRGKIVIYVAGNHEYYSKTISTHTTRMRQYAADLGIHFLENNSLVIGDVAFLGATMWTDFALFNDVPAAALAAEEQMSDYHVIDSPRIPQAAGWRHCAAA